MFTTQTFSATFITLRWNTKQLLFPIQVSLNYYHHRLMFAILLFYAPYFVVEFEDGISVVPAKKILEPPCASLRVENHCTVKWGKQKYCGVVRAMGKTLSITIIN